MKPEAEQALAKAGRCLTEARKILGIDLTDSAARMAYLTAFHAAQAFVYERTTKVAKTHSGVRSEFTRLAKDEVRIDRSLVSFLGRSYEFKTIADYGVDINISVAKEDAHQVIGEALRFLECISEILAGPPHPID